METRAKTEHGRPDQNTNARKLFEREGSGGTAQSDMKTGELATKKHSPSEKIERRSTVRVARQVWVQRAAHCKRVARKKPIPENRKVKSGGHARVHAGGTKKTYPNTHVSIGHTALRNKISRRRTMVRITPKDGREKDEKDSTPKTLERKAKKVLRTINRSTGGER